MSLSHIETLRKANDLRRCEIFSCWNMRNVICSCCGDVLFSQSLATLILRELPLLTDLIERERRPPLSSSAYPANTFSSLRQLKIGRCQGLKRLLTPELLLQLRNLEILLVSVCYFLVEIIGDEQDSEEAQEETTTIISALPKLKYLELCGLPELKSFCNCSIKVSDSLEEIRITHCLKWKRITLLWEVPHSHPSLKNIYVQKDWWDNLEWKHPETKVFLEPYVDFSEPPPRTRRANWFFMEIYDVYLVSSSTSVNTFWIIVLYIIYVLYVTPLFKPWCRTNRAYKTFPIKHKITWVWALRDEINYCELLM